MESTLINSHGLPEREWYKHLIYEPGLYTGYGVKTVPGVREAIEQNHWDQANQYVGLTAAALNAYCDRLEQATALLKEGN
jgi:N-acetylated-alpha-linked acidic dipeptidase